MKQGAHRLTSLLRESGVTPGKRSVKSKQSLGSAWAAFKEFAAVPVQRSELSDEPLSDGLLFEFGVFAFGGKWGKTFQLNFVRQLATADGDLQQVHLVVHFAPATFERIKNRVKAAPCADAEGCAARCSFVETDILGSSCVLSLARDRTARSTGHELASASVWSFDTGGSDTQAQRTSWTRSSKALLCSPRWRGR